MTDLRRYGEDILRTELDNCRRRGKARSEENARLRRALAELATAVVRHRDPAQPHMGVCKCADCELSSAVELAKRILDTIPSTDNRTLYECRCCSAIVGGTTDGRLDDPAWCWLENIDGRTAICPACAATPSSLEPLRDEYPNVRVSVKAAREDRR